MSVYQYRELILHRSIYIGKDKIKTLKLPAITSDCAHIHTELPITVDPPQFRHTGSRPISAVNSVWSMVIIGTNKRGIKGLMTTSQSRLIALFY